MKNKIIFLALFTLFIVSIIIINRYVNKYENKDLSNVPQNNNIVSYTDNSTKNKNDNYNAKEENVMEIAHINSDNFDSEVLKSENTVLIDFYADWCGPCKMLAPIIQEFANSHTNVKVVKINIDEEEALAARYHIMSIPTLVVIKNRSETNRAVGLITKAQIEKLIN